MRPEARPSFWLPVHLRVAAPRLGQVGSGRRLGEFWEAALGRGDKREESLSRLVLQLRPFNYLSICQALGGPGRGAASGTGRGVRRELGGRKAARAGSECCECVCGACCLGEQVQRQRAQGCVGERNCPGAANPAVGHGVFAGAAQVYSSSKDAGSKCGGRQVAEGCSVPVGKEVGCKDVPRLWRKAPGEVFSTADALR